MAEQIDATCLALPEVTRRAEGWARLFNIRRRTFCFLSGREEADGTVVPLLVLRADRHEREVLLAIGHPFSASRAGPDRIEVLLDDKTDWEEIRELVIESYRVLAPKKLIALLD
jgi:hypothetical protein